jgi:hypothetical protein
MMKELITSINYHEILIFDDDIKLNDWWIFKNFCMINKIQNQI